MIDFPQMDPTARRVLITILRRLQEIEKRRLEDMASLQGFLRAALAGNPDLLRRYELETEIVAESLSSHPGHDLDPLYDELIELLRSPDLPAEDAQEKLRQLLESFEGPPQ